MADLETELPRVTNDDALQEVRRHVGSDLAPFKAALLDALQLAEQGGAVAWVRAATRTRPSRPSARAARAARAAHRTEPTHPHTPPHAYTRPAPAPHTPRVLLHRGRHPTARTTH